MLSEKDNFIDVKFLYSQNLKEATHRFKVCNHFSQYLKVSVISIYNKILFHFCDMLIISYQTLGYYHDMSFNAFLYPNPKDTRKLLGFLFEFIFKTEDDGEGKGHELSNEWETQVQRRLMKWK